MQTAALENVLNHYKVVMDKMENANQTTRDDYDLKAGGVLSSLQRFGTLFGLRLAHLLFSASEETSKFLQEKDTNVQEALSSVCVLKCYFQCQRTDDQFNAFSDATESQAHDLEVDPPPYLATAASPDIFVKVARHTGMSLHVISIGRYTMRHVYGTFTLCRCGNFSPNELRG